MLDGLDCKLSSITAAPTAEPYPDTTSEIGERASQAPGPLLRALHQSGDLRACGAGRAV